MTNNHVIEMYSIESVNGGEIFLNLMESDSICVEVVESEAHVTVEEAKLLVVALQHLIAIAES